ncbi:hypothetical protein FIBSPDRAFT_876386 [Athelia psychrophila]|uniref:Uncharacterized protein n=1 Tax=Athelia psychrophila TaxID=1759441 RepID=A0A167WXX8_9AGAM|nr:hypothetical protein FIBSPDRAFT_876386 [Fibularhizoctonia sp. CBS 109695]
MSDALPAPNEMCLTIPDFLDDMDLVTVPPEGREGETRGMLVCAVESEDEESAVGDHA